MSTIVELAPDECEQLLRAGVFGRLVLLSGPRTEILPVTYVVHDDTLVVRAEQGSLLDRHGHDAPMLFEIDHVNYERARGWSVVARGRGERIVDESGPAADGPRPGPPRWLDHEEPVWIRLQWDEISGRRVGGGWDCLSELPVRRVWS